MAVYKVPQDVEADDKLLGPFSFRQFIYLIVALMGVTLAWALGRVFIPLAIVPLPIVVFFGALALPLRKDQPMEVYLAAVLAYHLKPRKRLWRADGVQSLVEIVAPKTVEEHRVKDLSEDEAVKRLSYLANLADSRGWAVRGVDMPQAETAMQADAFYEAQQAEDILDDTSSVTNSFNDMISQADARRREEAMKLMSRPAAASQIPPAPDPYAHLATPPLPPVQVGEPVVAQPVEPAEAVSYNPYPNAMRQSVIHPATSTAQPATPVPAEPAAPAQPEPAATPSNPVVSPDIMRLVDEGKELSVATIAHEAQRIREKEQKLSDDEVVISLR